jgi:hypothetical protein
MSCDIPQSITIKGKPGLYIPIGSPFPPPEEDDKENPKRLENNISPDRIREMMETSKTSGAKIYDYTGSDAGPGVQAYIVHYPIAEMKLDLAEYVRSATADGETEFSHPIPTLNESTFNSQYPNGCYLTRSSPPSSTEGAPLFSISLADMSRLVKEVNGGPFGLDLDYDPNFVNNIEVKIPALGIANYIPGEAINNNTKLRFVNTSKTKFEPQKELPKSGELEIYIRIKKPAGGKIAPEVVIEWETALFDTTGMNNLNGTYPIENSLGKFLGNGVAFKEVRGRIYVGGVGEKASLTLKGNGSHLIPEKSQLTEKDRPSFKDPFNEQLPSQSLGTLLIPLTDIINDPGKSTLEYQIFIEEMEIKEDEVDKEEGKIFADLVILLRLDFNISTPSTYRPNDFAKLDLGDVFPKIGGGGDLFGRTENSSTNSLFDQIESVTITLTKLENTILDPNKLAILVTSGSYNKLIDFNIPEPYVEFKMNELPKIFNPKFEILLRKEKTGDQFATLEIKRPAPGKDPVFDFFLTVEAKADIDHTISLSDL